MGLGQMEVDTNLPSQVGADERIGRAVFNGSDAGKSSPRARFFKKAFNGDRRMSVDRLSYGGMDELVHIHEREATTRQSSSGFYGWWILRAGTVVHMGCDVESCPTTANRWHAEVVRRDNDGDMDTEYWYNMAISASWQSKPVLGAMDL